MKTPNFYYNKTKMFLVILNDQLKPVMGYSGQIAQRKYNEMKQKQVKPSRADLLNEIELCKSVLNNQPDDMPVEIVSDYQKRYRIAKAQLQQLENKLIKK